MKTIAFIAALVLSVPAFAVQLVPEAQCSGVEKGQPIQVTTYVNSQKWCSAARRDMKSVVMLKEGGDLMGSAWQAVSSERGALTTHTNGTGRDKMELKLNAGSETAQFSRNGVTTQLSCIFVQYELDC